MPAFTSATDIANRALQHCGADRMDPTLGFNEGSRNAAETSFCYDKLREAELRRNLWVFATKKAAIRPVDVNTMLLQPALWSATTTYFRSSIVQDQQQNYWRSKIPANLDNDPLLTDFWEPYFGTTTVPLWDTTTTTGSPGYFAGELVYTAAGDGTYNVYESLISGNTDNPATATTWDATATYFKDQVVTFSSVAYKSLIDLNINNEPDLAPALWAVGTTYSAGTKVGGSDGNIYQSVGSGNVGHDPTTDGGVHWTNTGVLNPWTTVFVGGTGSINWLLVGGAAFPAGVALTAFRPNYPVGSGPASQNGTANIFRLPNAFLRQAPQIQKTATPVLGGPSGSMFNDWNYENDFIVTAEPGPIVLRFVADVTSVRHMDAMFCEGLAARVALTVCEPLTQSTAKLHDIAQEYAKFIGDARAINAIESGYVDTPDDDWVSVRY